MTSEVARSDDAPSASQTVSFPGLLSRCSSSSLYLFAEMVVSTYEALLGFMWSGMLTFHRATSCMSSLLALLRFETQFVNASYSLCFIAGLVVVIKATGSALLIYPCSSDVRIWPLLIRNKYYWGWLQTVLGLFVVWMAVQGWVC